MSKSFIGKLFDILFPEKLVCLSCGREAVVQNSGLCLDCEIGLERFISAPFIDKIDGYTAAYIYNDVSSMMVKKLKYSNAKYMAKPLAEALRIPAEWEINAVVPVPLHYKRLAKRGYNQSELIAKHLCERTGMRLDTSLLVRKKDTKQQTRMTVAGRKRNLKNAFIADKGCKGLKILLLDDVRTTGATLHECAAALKEAGCDKVYAVTVCFAKHD